LKARNESKKRDIALSVEKGASILDFMLVPGQKRPEIKKHVVHHDYIRFQEQAKTLKCRSIAEMLTERVILQDVIHTDRVLLGAKQLLLKYMLCSWAFSC